MRGLRVTSLKALAVALVCSNFSEAGGQPIVDLGYSIHQATLNASGPSSYYNFSNIRYARPPVGHLRFSAPRPPRGRNKTINTGQQSVICPQSDPAWIATVPQFLGVYLTGQNISNFTTPKVSQSPMANGNLSSLPSPDSRTSEDCLFLDVFVPTNIFNSTKRQKKRAPDCESGKTCKQDHAGAPVLVWIYGGGYTGGDKTSSGNPAGLIASSLQNGSEGVVFVAMNYRLGLFGWLSGSDNVTANAGLLDQRLALEWVQKNIHHFGGDRSRVTVMGESAGGGSIMHHITSHGGNGSVPFQKAIPQSPAFQPFVPAQSKTIFQQVLGNASVLANKTITSAEQLRALPYEILYELNQIVTGLSTYGSFTFGPVVDPRPGSYVPDFPARLLSQGKFHNVSLVVGHNGDEGLLFTPPYIQTQDEFISAIQTIFPSSNASTTSYITDVLYPPIYNGSYRYTSAIGRTSVAISDFLVGCNANILATKLNPGYAYLFSVPPALHGEDVPYTFFNGDTSTSDEGLPVNGTVAKVFQKYLTNFAMTGNPTAVGYQDFVTYGQNVTLTNIGLTGLGTRMKDPGAVPQCKFWQDAPFYT
ncbi:alpha/beta-hydrolase [Stipitochalara longipes BDJ]|nr:alpha/beta-hydrolase [Stipitochalara longipes BDJ]